MRWIKGTIAVGCAILCSIALVNWIWSYLPPHAHFVSHRGSLLIASVSGPDESLQSYGGPDAMIAVMVHWGDVYQHFLGFAHVSGTYVNDFQIIVIPYWFIFLLTGLFPAVWWRDVRRRRVRRRAGQCLGCGYDLRGSGDRCPECGARVNGCAVEPAPPPTAESLGSRAQV